MVFDYNPKNKINTYVSILKQEFQLVMKNKLGKLKKKITIRSLQYYCHRQDPQMTAKISGQKLKEKQDVFIVTRDLPQIIYKGR